MSVWVLTGFDRGSDELVYEAELPNVTTDALRDALGLPGDPMVGELPLPAEAAHVVGVDVPVGELDFARVDYFVGEYSSTDKVERRDGYYLPPRALPAFPDAVRVRPRTQDGD